MKKVKENKPVTYYTEYDKEVLFEKIEGLVNSFINYVKGRKKLNDDYSDTEYNPSGKEIYRKIELIMVDFHENRKSVRLLIEYGNGNSDVPLFHGNERQVREWVSVLKPEMVFEFVVGCFEKWASSLK